MNLKKHLILAAALLFNIAFILKVEAKKESQDELVGAWWFNLPQANDFGVAVFYADGTWLMHGSTELTQATSLNHVGAYITVAPGNWTKISEGNYFFDASCVVLARNLDCSTLLPLDPPDLAAPACPVQRIKFFGNFVFSTGTDGQATTVLFSEFRTLDTFEKVADGPATFIIAHKLAE